MKILGLLVAVTGFAMLWPLFWALYDQDGQTAAFVFSILTCLGSGALLYVPNRRVSGDVYRREALVVVGLGWLFAAAFGALPFVFSGVLPGYTDAFFETMSGLTTTGASVFTADTFADCPRSIMFWRCLTHWIGGMGIVVLFVAVFPLLGVGGKELFRSEVPGPTPEGFRPRVAATAAVLWGIYIAMTVLLAGLLCLEGMDLFDALCHTFATLATGGFSTHFESVAAYDSPVIDVTLGVFMLLAGSNFALYHRALRGEPGALWRDAEWRVYVAIIGGATLLVAALTWGHGVYGDPVSALRHSFFQVVSLQTTTGFATADFDLWPAAARFLLVAIMFIGGCAGSTAGGIKVIRWILLAKVALYAVRRSFNHHAVVGIKVGGRPVEPAVRDAAVAFSILWMGIFAVATLFVAGFADSGRGRDYDLVSAATAVAATLNNVGPGLAAVGASQNFADVAIPAKWMLSLCMALGRLELFAILAVFAPSNWRPRRSRRLGPGGTDGPRG